MDTYQDVLRRLVVNDKAFLGGELKRERSLTDLCGLTRRDRSMSRVVALIACDGSRETYRWVVEDALEAGYSPDEIVGVLLASSEILGVAAVVQAAPKVADALDYDVFADLEGVSQLRDAT